MKKLSIKDFHSFMRGEFRACLRTAFKSHQIFCEADLQSFAWWRVKTFLEKHEESHYKFRVLNKPYLRGASGTYPDLVVFRREKPWVVIELKESRRLTVTTAAKEREKLGRVREKLHHKRGYLVYVARYGEKRALRGPKGEGNAYHFFEVPIVLELEMKREKVKEWTRGFRAWSKYVIPKV
jgi:hypothetical protein